MQPVVSVSPVFSSAGKLTLNSARNFAPVLINRKRPDIPHKADKLFAFTLERKTPAADFINRHHSFHALIHSFRDKEHMVTVLDFVYSTFIFSVHIFLEHIPYYLRQQADAFFCIWYYWYYFCHYFYLLSFCLPALPACNLHLQYAGFCRPQNIGRISAERKSPAAGKDSRALKQRKERTRRRIRLMNLGRFFFLISCIYYTRFFGGRKFLSDFSRAPVGSRQSAFNAASGSRHNICQPVSGSLHPASSFLQPAVSLYR